MSANYPLEAFHNNKRTGNEAVGKTSSERAAQEIFSSLEQPCLCPVAGLCGLAVDFGTRSGV
eukprot:scaffold194380_cov20-Prasinocladus_malaysianus.AAC.1